MPSLGMVRGRLLLLFRRLVSGRLFFALLAKKCQVCIKYIVGEIILFCITINLNRFVGVSYFICRKFFFKISIQKEASEFWFPIMLYSRKMCIKNIFFLHFTNTPKITLKGDLDNSARNWMKKKTFQIYSRLQINRVKSYFFPPPLYTPNFHFFQRHTFSSYLETRPALSLIEKRIFRKTSLKKTKKQRTAVLDILTIFSFAFSPLKKKIR